MFVPIRLIAPAALALGAALTGPVAAEDAPDPDQVIATVNGTEITVAHLIAMRAGLPQQFQGMPNEALLEPLLEQLIDQTALMQAGADALSLRDRVTLDNNTRTFVANAWLSGIADAAVTDAALDEAYAAFSAEYGGQEPVTEYNASHIIVEREEDIHAIADMLASGEEFGDVAERHSMDGAAAQGGSLGWFGPGVMIEEFEELVATMEVGEISDPLQTRFGWHVVKLNDTRLAQVPTLDEVRDDLVAEIHLQAVQAEIDRVKAEAEIVRTTDALDPAILSRNDLLDD